MSAVRRGVVALGVILTALGTASAGSATTAPELDPSFGGTGRVVVDRVSQSETLRAATVQGDGRTVAVGDRKTALGQSAPWVVRRTADGSRDPLFSTNLLVVGNHVDGVATSVAVQPDGRIVVAGDLHVPDDIGVWRLTPLGDPDPTFGGGDGFAVIDSGGDESTGDVALGPGGTIVVVGHTTAPGPGAAIYRLKADGTPDGTLDQDGALGLGGRESRITGVGVGPDGSLLLAGSLGTVRPSVWRRTLSGAVDTTYGGGDGMAEVPAASAGVTDVLLEPDGRALVAGRAVTGPGVVAVVARLGPDGAPDASFGGEGGARVDLGGFETFNRLVPLPGGGVAALGYTASSTDAFVSRFSGSGMVDRSFGDDGFLVTSSPSMVAVTRGIASGPDGTLVVVGDDARVEQHAVLVRLRAASGAVVAPPAAPAASVPGCHGHPATLVGSADNDRLRGTRKADVVVALGGDDVIKGLGGNDVVCAGDGNDKVSGGSGKDRLYGERGKDRLVGGSGKDRLVGGPDRDTTHAREEAPS